MHRILGLAGFARVGKDTLCGRILEIERPAYRVAFADSLKHEVCREYRVNAWTSDPAEKEKIRPILIEHGGKRRREDPAYWVKRAAESISKLPLSLVVITDVRYANEADWIHDRGGAVVLLSREGISAVHPTEAESVSQIRWDIALHPYGGMWSLIDARRALAALP